jgi:hypothetical protein
MQVKIKVRSGDKERVISIEAPTIQDIDKCIDEIMTDKGNIKEIKHIKE